MPKPSGISGMHLRVVQEERLPTLDAPFPLGLISQVQRSLQSGQLRSTAGQCAGFVGVLSDMVETVSDWEFLHCLRFCTAMAALFNVQYVSRQKAQSAMPVCLPKLGIMHRSTNKGIISAELQPDGSPTPGQKKQSPCSSGYSILFNNSNT